jgi:hypothetical protein
MMAIQMITSPERKRWQQLVETPLPHCISIRRNKSSEYASDISWTIRQELLRNNIPQVLQPGSSVAIGVGSRKITSQMPIVKAVVDELKRAGCVPFIIPAMGSHGHGTASGQAEILRKYGITEESIGTPIRSTTNVLEVGRLNDGRPVFFDAAAFQADAIVPINRIKPHTAFRSTVESGLSKMLAVGFGNPKGAESLHAGGFSGFADRLIAARDIIIERTNFLFGIGIIENADGEVAHIEVVKKEDIREREPSLLQIARELMPKLPVNDIDVLVVREIGKDISGAGMDPNVTGRSAGDIKLTNRIEKIVVLNLSKYTQGNAVGIGMADITTERVVTGINLDSTWFNTLTSTTLMSARIPVFMPNDRMAIQLAIKTCRRPEPSRLRLVCIENTQKMGSMLVSDAVLSDEAFKTNCFEIGVEQELIFDAADNLIY